MDCQHATCKWLCAREATWGLYRIPEAGVRTGLGTQLLGFCGQHKPKLKGSMNLRNVKLASVADWLAV